MVTADLSTKLRSVENISREGPLTPQISPLRSFGAPVEMAKGRTALPTTVVAEQGPFFIALGGPKAHDSSGRKHSQERSAGPQISPLRCAPVEMTKGRVALPATVVAEQDPFFIALGGPKAHDSSGRKTFPGKVRWTADLSTTLLRSSGRDDKGEGGASNNSSC